MSAGLLGGFLDPHSDPHTYFTHWAIFQPHTERVPAAVFGIFSPGPGHPPAYLDADTRLVMSGSGDWL